MVDAVSNYDTSNIFKYRIRTHDIKSLQIYHFMQTLDDTRFGEVALA